MFIEAAPIHLLSALIKLLIDDYARMQDVKKNNFQYS